MKFSLFIHMERYNQDISHRELFEQLTELTLLAEAGGFSTVWTGEHHGMEYTISPNPLPVLAYLAARTSTIRLGAGTIVAPFWSPIRAAGEFALLDVISNGRMEMGVARGAYQYEFDRMADGLPAVEGGKYLREMLPAIRELWKGNYSHEGEIWKFPCTTSSPKPVQSAPPMWVAAREQDSHNFAVANGCNVMVTPLMSSDEMVATLSDRFNTALANYPNTPRPQLMVLRHAHVHLPEDPEGWKLGASAIAKFYRTFDAWFANKITPDQGLLDPSPEEKFKDRAEFELDNIRKNTVIGTPEEVIARIRYYEELGVDEFSFWADNSLPFAEKKKSLELFIQHVVPAFR